ncbi:MAG: translation initiation factor IF-5A [Candidatus Marsarchaeota archaeon]|jgi:translation initiation factor eIF-5A|nr:translation initiation factor IF-5A [Candidatus Marsarchaeota archaeon]MCL5094980.1 translation initiation factor IF-5A [Candidatus Marsarchaeota archaeon]
MSGEISLASMKELKIGRFVLIDDIPCKVVEIDVSSPGKHGSSKMRVTAIGIFDGQKKTLLKPSDSDVQVPVITKSKSQVVSVTNNTAQLMDLDTYNVFELAIPQELLNKLKPGNEVEVIEAMNRKIINKIVGEAK